LPWRSAFVQEDARNLAIACNNIAGGAGTGLSRSVLLTFRPHHYHHHHYHHHYVQHLERKIVARVAKADHHHLRPSGYAEELTPRNISFEMSITQMPINKTYALAPGHHCSASTREALARGNCTVKCCLLSSRKRQLRQIS
jgi:hypothetical protein